MKHHTLILALVGLLAAVLLAPSGFMKAGSKTRSAAKPPPESISSEAYPDPALRVHLDPATGQRLENPAAPAPPPQAAPGPDWFEEIQGTSVGGGVKLNLRGRWQHALGVRVGGPNTKVEATCLAPSSRP